MTTATEAPDGGQPGGGQGAATPYGWILHPVFDAFFVCGGMLWVFFAFHYFVLGGHLSGAPAAQGLYVMVAVLTHVFADAHIVATGWRLAHAPKSQESFLFYTRIWPTICLGLFAAGILHPAVTPILVKLSLFWVIQHFMAQSYGIALIYCYKRGYILSAFEKSVFHTVMNLTAAYAILRQLVYPAWGERTVVFTKVPFWGPLPEWTMVVCSGALIGAGALLVLLLVRKAMVQRQVMPLPAIAVALTGVLIHVWGSDLAPTVWIYAPIFYHGSQYLAISLAWDLKSKGLPEGVPTSRIASVAFGPAGLRYMALVVGAGIVLYVGVPRILEEAGIATYTLGIATAYGALNFFHFLTDRYIWRLRDPSIRERLLA